MPKEKKQILVIEDEKPMAIALKLKLEKAGFIVENAFDGQEGIEKLKSNKFDLALLDLVMPKVDGFGVLEEAKKQGIKTKIIITSNLSQNTDVTKAKELGAADFFVKSDIDISELVKKVVDIVGK